MQAEVHDEHSDKDVLEVSLSGHMLLANPLLNKGTTFPEDERHEFNLLGLLPPHIASLEVQLARTYENYRLKTDDLERYIFLSSLQDRNEILFYRLFSEHMVNTLRSGRNWPANVEHCPQSWTLGQTFLEKLLLIWLLSSIFCK